MNIEEIKKKENIYAGWGKHDANRFTFDELTARGYKPVKLGKYVYVSVDGMPLYFWQAYTSCFSRLSALALGNKAVTKNLLSLYGVSVAKGRDFSDKEKEGAKIFAMSLSSAVIKPRDGARGKGVAVGVKTEDQFEVAWHHAVMTGARHILVEEEFIGEEARYLVIDGVCVSVTRREPPTVIGDGVNSIRALVKNKNAKRKAHPGLAGKLIKINPHRVDIIRRQGYELNDVPELGKAVLIDYMSSITRGGETTEISEYVHESYKAIAEKVCEVLPGMDVLGVDILAKNHFEDASEGSYIVIEANTKPGLGSHQVPVYGKPKWLIPDIVSTSINNLNKAACNRRRAKQCLEGALSGVGSARRHENSEKNLSSILVDMGYSRKKIGDFVFLDKPGSRIVLGGRGSSNIPSILARALSNNFLLRYFLQDIGILVPEGRGFELDQLESAKAYASTLSSFFLTPYNPSDVPVIELMANDVARMEALWRKIVKDEDKLKKAPVKGVYVDLVDENSCAASASVLGGKCVALKIDKLPGDWADNHVLLRRSVVEIIERLADSLPMIDMLEVKLSVSIHGEVRVQHLNVFPEFEFGEGAVLKNGGELNEVMAKYLFSYHGV